MTSAKSEFRFEFTKLHAEVPYDKVSRPTMAHAEKSDILVARYASPEMAELFSREQRIRLWRQLWIALAEAEHELGLPVTKAQIQQLKKYRDKINWEVAEKKEREIRHDVMAHVHAYAAQCKRAAPIIHLGATSAYVTDNADILLIRDGLKLLARKMATAIDRLATFAVREQST
ncbi:MAG TPA: hypothetical protein VI895_05570, partial [Bdellovibrionota bacterium]|nr:hypothetical protein [Bdellovibrionota bacterium]